MFKNSSLIRVCSLSALFLKILGHLHTVIFKKKWHIIINVNWIDTMAIRMLRNYVVLFLGKSHHCSLSQW